MVRTSQSGIIPDTQNMIGLSELIPDNKDIDPTFQVSVGALVEPGVNYKLHNIILLL